LMGGVRNMKIPADLRDVYSVNGTLDVEVLEDKVRPGSSGMTLIPFRYRFPGQQNFSMGIGALTSSENVAESCLGEGC